MTKAKKTIPPYTMSRFGILNHVGTIWTPETFDTPEQAKAYMDDYAARNKNCYLGKHTVIPVNVTVEAAQQ